MPNESETPTHTDLLILRRLGQVITPGRSARPGSLTLTASTPMPRRSMRRSPRGAATVMWSLAWCPRRAERGSARAPLQ